VAIWFEPFEPGVALLRLAYTLVLQRAETTGELTPRTIAALRALVLDAATRAGTDKSAPQFLEMDDKWLFTRAYIERAAREAGFSSIEILSHAAHGRLYQDAAAIQLRLRDEIEPSALPKWAWDLLAQMDICFSDDAKRDMLHEGTIILRKAG
jgi:hypothetical protein